MTGNRFDRNVRFFGEDGQHHIRATHAVLVGIGGLGTHVAQQLAFLGVGRITLIDSQELDSTNKNRYVGCRFDDPVPGSKKVDLGERLIKSIDPEIAVAKVDEGFISDRGFEAIKHGEFVFGCVDSEGARLILTEFCSAYGKPLFDLATDIVPGDATRYGGRVCFSRGGDGCVLCLGELDAAEATIEIEGGDVRARRDAIYGIDRTMLSDAGPSVVTINGVIASLATTEFMVHVANVRPATRLLKYYGHNAGRVTVPIDVPASDCFICKGLYGKRDSADLKHYIRDGVGKRLR